MMATLREEARDIPVAFECDICVLGGSCTGVFAAVAAARLGARVALVERAGLLGGTATAGLVSIWHSLHDMSRKNRIIAGLTLEVTERLRRRAAAEGPDEVTLNTAELAIELDMLVREAGVRPFLHTVFAAPIMREGRVSAVAVEDKTGRRAIAAKYFIDATGDGDLVVRAGFPCWANPGALLQPPTACFLLRGLPALKEKDPTFRLGTAVHDTRRPEALTSGFLWDACVPGVPELRLVAGTRMHGANCADADELTRAEMEGRRQIRTILDILRTYHEGGSAAAIGAIATCIGIRETRHMTGLHTLTEEELLSGTRFPDAIANGTYQVDIHHSDRPGITFRYLDGRETHHIPGQSTPVGRWRPETSENPPFWQIPYRCLVPQGSANVLAAGRIISVDRGAYGAVRVMVNTNQTGEAAGTAAHLALTSGCDVAAVDTARLRSMMAKQGSIIL